MSQIKNIVFDLGGVLIDWDPRQVYRNIFRTEQEVETFLNNICLYEWNIQQDAGRSLQDGTNLLVAKFPEWTEEIKAYYGRWEEMLVGPIAGTVAILKRFLDDEGYNVYALTNWSAETYPIAQKRFDFLNWFQGVVVSGDEKCIKPDPKIYNILFERYNLKPEASVFIDDNKANVEASIALGMPAILFESPEQLKVDLAKLGIK